MHFNNVDPQGNPTNPITNQLVNYGWEYVWHCHILSHEEMDMMRPQSLVLPPYKPDGLAFSFTGSGNNRRIVVTFNDNSITETSFLVQRTIDGTNWTDAGTLASPLNQPNNHEVRTFTDPTAEREHGLPVQSRGQEHRRLRCGVPADDGPVGVRHSGCQRSGGSDQPDGDAAGRAAGQPDLAG